MALFLGGMIAGCGTTIIGIIVGYGMGVSNARPWMAISKILMSSFASMLGNDDANEGNEIDDVLGAN